MPQAAVDGSIRKKKKGKFVEAIARSLVEKAFVALVKGADAEQNLERVDPLKYRQNSEISYQGPTKLEGESQLESDIQPVKEKDDLENPEFHNPYDHEGKRLSR